MKAAKSFLMTFGILAGTVVVGGIVLVVTRPRPTVVGMIPPAPTATPQPTPTPGPLSVYVTGAVAQPNTTVTLPPGSRVEDAISAAGGSTDSADLTRVNLADPLRDGAQVHVPALAQPAAPELATPSGPLPINSASFDELEALPRVGPVLAQRIIEHREANGPFRELADLDAVSGIGPSLLETLAELITFD